MLKVPAEVELGSEADWLVPVEEPGDALAWLRRCPQSDEMIINHKSYQLEIIK